MNLAELYVQISRLLNPEADDIIKVDDRGWNALGVAASNGKYYTVSRMLDRGADVNMACSGLFGSALATAAYYDRIAMVILLLDRGADINMACGGYYDSALAAAAASDTGFHMVSLLLDRGADVNMACGGYYGSALAAAAYRSKMDTVSLLLERGADVNMACGGDYGSALAVAAIGGRVSTVSLLLDRGADINMACGGYYGSALAAAARGGQDSTVSLLLDQRADINMACGGYYGSALAAAAEGGQDSTVSLLLDRGADLNLVGGNFGSALGRAAYNGNKELVTSLIARGADPFHVGGAYETPTGEYPSALNAAGSGNAGADILEAIQRMMNSAGKNEDTTLWPPFPMPYTGNAPRKKLHTVLVCASPSTERHIDLEFDPVTTLIRNLESNANSDIHTHAWDNADNLTPELADLECEALGEKLLGRALVALVGVKEALAGHLKVWIRNDIRYFIKQRYDLGLAYAAARVAWKNFNDQNFNIAAHRHHWLAQGKQIDKERTPANAIYADATGKQFIQSPYEIMPRRIWDLKSNRVIEFQMLHSELLARKLLARECLTRQYGNLCPPFWAITHSWTNTMDPVETPINQYEWPVPLPQGLNLELAVRNELLKMGAEYVWLDVLCLRQHSDTNDHIRDEEWKLDVPTIGNIYLTATALVRYFNGLGQPFRPDGWDDERHWLCRAWTLQEIRTEDTTINAGGMTIFDNRDRANQDRANRDSARIIMETTSTVNGKITSLREALRPVVKLAAQADNPNGCSVYDLVKQMTKRHATQPTDKVAGLLYLLRTTVLPTYDETVSEEDAWIRCFHVLPVSRKLEILFDCPFVAVAYAFEWDGNPGGESSKLASRSSPWFHRWFPTWRQLMAWPDRDSAYDHTPAMWPVDQGSPQLEFNDQLMEPGSLLLSDIWAISHVILTYTNAENLYQVRSRDRIFDFYYPFKCQKPIDTNMSDQLFTLATCYPNHSYNWAVCELIRTQKTSCKTADGVVKMVEFEVLKKVGVLRTDHCSELLLGAGRRDSILKKINALFL